MKRFLLPYAVALFLSVIGIAAEKKVQLENLPPLVQKTIQDQIKGAELKGLTQEKENGKTVYEVETIKNRRTRDVLIDAVGAILEVEEETTLDEIPGPAKATIEKAAANGKLIRVEVVTKGNSTFYEAAIKQSGKNSEIKVGVDGNILK
jgi:uncharacterized membrane protein YkoI